MEMGRLLPYVFGIDPMIDRGAPTDRLQGRGQVRAIRAQLEAGLRASVDRVQFEDATVRGDLFRMVEIDAVDEADEQESAWDTSGVRSENISEELDSLRRVELGRHNLILTVALDDGRAPGGAEVAHPVDLAPRRPDEPPAIHPEDGDRRAAKDAALPAANHDEPIRAERHPCLEKELQDRSEQSDGQWNSEIEGVHARWLHGSSSIGQRRPKRRDGRPQFIDEDVPATCR